jgi:hypothetical protein
VATEEKEEKEKEEKEKEEKEKDPSREVGLKCLKSTSISLKAPAYPSERA